jgi:hypothetical protein
MTISVRPKVYSLPSYSLTGDLMGYLRCGLQYRYTRIGRLPASRPVQLWFGEFIHGVMEEAFRRYKDSVEAGNPILPPWEIEKIEDIHKLIKARLAARGLYAWDPDLEALGDNRAEAAIQDLGPHLFPLIHRAEVRLYGARMLPQIEESLQFREADRYEMVGIVDVVTHVELSDPQMQKNPLVQLLLNALPKLESQKFEIIIDYKGMRRPPSVNTTKADLWNQYAWQVQTYAELRRKQDDALPIAAGVLLYMNELFPTQGDLENLKREIKNGTTDAPPEPGSKAEKLLKEWSSGKPLPSLPLEYRLARAIRVIPITKASIAEALEAFDCVVKKIETCRGQEAAGTSVLNSWDRNSSEESTCVVCDSRTFCPDYQTHYANQHGDTKPRLPGVRKKA